MILWDCIRNIDKSEKPARVPVSFEGIRLMMDVSLDRIARVRTLPIDATEEETTRG